MVYGYSRVDVITCIIIIVNMSRIYDLLENIYIYISVNATHSANAEDAIHYIINRILSLNCALILSELIT